MRPLINRPSTAPNTHTIAVMVNTITAIVCVFGAVLGLLISGRKEHADEPEVQEQPTLAPQVEPL